MVGGPVREKVFEDYWRRLRTYQGVEPDPDEQQQPATCGGAFNAFKPKRALFAFFPTYRSSPLPSSFDRVVSTAVG